MGFILGCPDEDGPPVKLPQPEILSRNGSYMAYRRMEEHVGKFRDFLRASGKMLEEPEVITAKLMARWRSGAPLVLAPEKNDPALGADPQRNNDLNYTPGPERWRLMDDSTFATGMVLIRGRREV